MILTLLAACSSTPTPPSPPIPEPEIPEFSGGSTGPNTASKKAQLTVAYEDLARAQAKLEHSRHLLAYYQLWSPNSYAMITGEQEIGAKYEGQVAERQAEVERLREDLRQAGVTITTHY